MLQKTVAAFTAALLCGLVCGACSSMPAENNEALSFSSAVSLNSGRKFLSSGGALSQLFLQAGEAASGMSIKYSLPEKPPEKNEWHSALEKNLLRAGMELCEKEENPPGAFSSQRLPSGPAFVVKSLSFSRAQENVNTGREEGPRWARSCEFYIAAISASIVSGEGKILWSGEASASSWDLIESSEKISPALEINCVMPGPCPQGAGGVWECRALPNYETVINGDSLPFHRKALIEFTVNLLIGTLRPGSGA